MSVQKSHGLWFPVLYDPKSKKHIWYEGFEKKGDALKEERRLRHLQDENKLIMGNTETFQSVFDEWKELIAPELYTSQASRETSTNNIVNHVLPVIGGYLIDKIDKQTLQKLFHRMKKPNGDPLSDATKKKVKGTLNSIFNSAIDWGYIIENPCSSVKIKTPKKTEISIWSGEDISYFFNLDFVKNSCYYLPLLILATTGMRRGEVCALQWKNYTSGTLRLTHSMDVYGHLTDMKTDSSHRTIVLMSITDAAICNQQKHQIKIAEMIGDTSPISRIIKPWDYICTNEFNDYIRPNSLTLNFRKLIKKNNKENTRQLNVIKLKELRHSFASFALANGENIKIISEILGHSRTSTTHNFYIGVMETLQAPTMTRLEEKMLNLPNELPNVSSK